MDNLRLGEHIPSTSSSRSLFHHQTSSPLPILGHGVAVDGIGSPTDQAYTPPGILTKLDTIKKSSPYVKLETMSCSSCGKKVTCFCKKCTLEKLRFYSRKENIYNKTSEKKRLERSIEEILKDEAAVSAEQNKTHERIARLKKELQNVRHRVELKKEKLRGLEKVAPIPRFEELFKKQEANRANILERIERKEEMRKLIETKVADLRRDLCTKACVIFSIQEVDVETVEQQRQPNSKDPRGNRNWTVIDKNVMTGRRYLVRSAYVNEKMRMKLAEALSSGAFLSLPTDLHPPFAAIMHTAQLVQLFIYILNLSLPFEMSHRDFSLRERWSKEILEQEWQTLCEAVIWLCRLVGMDETPLNPSEPLSNLILFANYVVQDRENITKIETYPLSHVASFQGLSLQRQDSEVKDEEDESWIVVN
ncbi:unnamed protein product [Caenorhabditis auriculariae]|uniref:Beclin 1-associated autophagy-related key regulator n=1 Tax=Caenorhabditis auriculariae TaxID=2777116 RepID=A0A8S1H6H6_9PELO|nr:unnamed protein product [Caenorhabditis auriculariae]